MDNSTGSGMSDMTPWLHFGNADYLLFHAWQPSSRAAVAGTCIGLVVFSILERLLAAYRRTQELRWKANKSVVISRDAHSHANERGSSGDGSVPTRLPLAPPFSPSRDVSRGVFLAVQATFSYALMMMIMTYNGAYIISVILGLGIGEVMFGRISRF